MFTGIVQHLGRVRSVDPRPFGAALTIEAQGWEHRAVSGESIAVNGCCLTVAGGKPAMASPDSRELQFEIVQQTLKVTTLGDLKAGDMVNLERAVTPQTMLGGHIVQGHIDAVGVVIHVERANGGGGEHRLRIATTDDAMDCIIARGSIAVNGVSLTVAAAGDESFEVALIPTTLRLTNLGGLEAGARVNLETDYLAKVVINYLRRREG